LLRKALPVSVDDVELLGNRAQGPAQGSQVSDRRLFKSLVRIDHG